MVGVRGFEPPTYGTQNRRATRLRYTPREAGRSRRPHKEGARERRRFTEPHTLQREASGTDTHLLRRDRPHRALTPWRNPRLRGSRSGRFPRLAPECGIPIIALPLGQDYGHSGAGMAKLSNSKTLVGLPIRCWKKTPNRLVEARQTPCVPWLGRPGALPQPAVSVWMIRKKTLGSEHSNRWGSHGPAPRGCGTREGRIGGI